VRAPAPGLYVGRVRHQRLVPPRQVFENRIFLPLVDTALLPSTFPQSRLWSGGRLAAVRYHRADYLGPPERALDEAVRDEVETLGGPRPGGPVLMLAHLRTLGWCFNPLSLYYCFDEDGGPASVLAEVTNTPWGESQRYLVPFQGDGTARARHDKALHVSPFLGMDMTHHFRLSAPADRLSALLENLSPEGPVFRASMLLARREATPAQLRRVLLTMPAMTARVSASIYWKALRLRARGAPVHRHVRVPI
jgi:DUF1365 family protein